MICSIPKNQPSIDFHLLFNKELLAIQQFIEYDSSSIEKGGDLMPSKHNLGENLKNIRKSQGYTQAELAQKLFVTTQAISKWERGESEPGLEHIQNLTRILNVSADSLLGIVPNAAPALLAVDGGGTKTEFVLISPQGQLLKRLVLPGANPNSCTVEGSLEILSQGIDQMLHTGYRILGVYIGCAGMSSGNNGNVIAGLLRKSYPALFIQCESDMRNILACAQDPDNAIAVISGTGSVVFATNRGQLLRAGGGGWQLDPLGSGYELGRAALAAALAHADGTGPETTLTKSVEARLGDTVWNSISKIYSFSPAQIAEFSRLVTQAWDAGDTVAAQIVEQNCRRLAELVQRISLKTPAATQVVLGGSILVGCHAFRQLLTQMLPKHLQAVTIPCPPVFGACLQCARLCRLPAPDMEIFLTQYALEV